MLWYFYTVNIILIQLNIILPGAAHNTWVIINKTWLNWWILIVLCIIKSAGNNYYVAQK